MFVLNTVLSHRCHTVANCVRFLIKILGTKKAQGFTPSHTF